LMNSAVYVPEGSDAENFRPALGSEKYPLLIV